MLFRSHAPNTANGSLSVTSGYSYPIVIYFGENAGGAAMTFQYKYSSGSLTSNLSNEFGTSPSSNYGVTKIGGGALTLSGANTYTGATTVSAGTLKLGSSGALGTSSDDTTGTSSVTVSSGAALDLNGQSVTRAAPLTLTGTGVSTTGALTNSSSSEIGRAHV